MRGALELLARRRAGALLDALLRRLPDHDANGARSGRHRDVHAFPSRSARSSCANLSWSRGCSGYPGRVWLSLLGLGLVSHRGMAGDQLRARHMRAAPLSVGLLGQARSPRCWRSVARRVLEPNQVVGGLLVRSGSSVTSAAFPSGTRGQQPAPPARGLRLPSHPAQQHAGRRTLHARRRSGKQAISYALGRRRGRVPRGARCPRRGASGDLVALASGWTHGGRRCRTAVHHVSARACRGESSATKSWNSAPHGGPGRVWSSCTAHTCPGRGGHPRARGP